MVVDFEFSASEIKPWGGLNKLIIKQLKARFDKR